MGEVDLDRLEPMTKIFAYKAMVGLGKNEDFEFLELWHFKMRTEGMS